MRTYKHHNKVARIPGKQLGAGNFGIVFEGTISGKVNTATIGGGVTRVAIKMVKSKTDDDALKSLISELKILIHLGSHLNVVNLIGAYTLDIVAGDYIMRLIDVYHMILI